MKRIFLALSLGVAVLPVGAEVSPARLRCEYKVNPVGIDVTKPRLSWVVESAQRGEKQTAYQILVASSPNIANSDLWNSGKITGNATNQIAYAGKSLQSGQTAYWSVRSWDKNGKPSKLSAPAQWTMALLNTATEWKGQWINLEKLPDAPVVEGDFKDASWIWFP